MKRFELKLTRDTVRGVVAPLVIAMLMCSSGCGQKGGLYLPDKDKASYTSQQEK